MRKTRTPAAKMTPKMKRTLVFKQSTPTPKKFTIGKASHKEEKVVTGMVKEAKRKQEDKQMRERRETQVEMVRKPLLATPNQKRNRKDDGEW